MSQPLPLKDADDLLETSPCMEATMVVTNRKGRCWTIAWLVAAAIVWSSAARASVIAQWTFETSQPLMPNSATISGIIAEVGAGTASGVHASSATDYTNPVGNGSAESFSSNTWAAGDYYQFSVSTIGLQNITFGWHQTTSASGNPIGFKVEADFGSGFSDILNPYFVRDDSWSSASSDPDSIFAPISLGAAAADKSTIFIRLTLLGSPTNPSSFNPASTIRVDNVTVSGDIVPEPATWLAVGGCLLLGLAASWRGIIFQN